jgi:hypothetical protein
LETKRDLADRFFKEPIDKANFLTTKQLKIKIQHISIMSDNPKYTNINFDCDDGTASPAAQH